LGVGGAQPNISITILKGIEIPLPPLETQKQIAQTLDVAAELLAMRKQHLAELDNLNKSLFCDMFGDPVKNEKVWKKYKLENITTKIGSGATPRGGRESYQGEGISLIRSMNVYNGAFKYDQLAYINDDQAKQLNNVTVEENDVLINITGASVARSCIVPSNVLPARVNQHVSIIRVKTETANPVYINNVLTNSSYQTYLLSIGGAGGATREAITKQQLRELSIPLPNIRLQNRFSAIVTKIEEQKVLVKKAIKETQYLFDSLMSEYFDV
jgi:type I restriction enzyme S subunit